MLRTELSGSLTLLAEKLAVRSKAGSDSDHR
jgi:hypothetical protein